MAAPTPVNSSQNDTQAPSSESALFPNLGETQGEVQMGAQTSEPQVQPAAAPAPVAPSPAPAAPPTAASNGQPKEAYVAPDQTQPDAIAEELKSLQNSIISGNIPQLVLTSMTHAVNLRSSDIHIEPEKNTVRIRFRIDGVLRQVVEYPNNIHPAVVSRIKIMANLKIDEQRIPQDGRAQVTTPDGRELDLRVSSLPTVNGEKVVMRLLKKTGGMPDLPELGLRGGALKHLEDAILRPHGIIVICGPTGSGKTLAFGCGIVEHVIPSKGLQALILTPTRELAEQVKNSLSKLSQNLRIISVYGGVSINPQIESLGKAEVVVAVWVV